jgi:dsRNA-specific ribonuclease
MTSVNAKGELFERIQKAKRNMPSFTYEQRGPPHSPEFKVIAMFDDGRKVISSWKGSKRLAEHDACGLALKFFKVEAVVKPCLVNVSANFDSAHNYKGDLQEYCQKTMTDFPIYEFSKYGVDHKPEYTVTVIHKDCTKSYNVRFLSKKLAEQYGAWSVLSSIAADMYQVKPYLTGNNMYCNQNPENVTKKKMDAMTRSGSSSKTTIVNDNGVVFGTDDIDQFCKEEILDVLTSEDKEEIAIGRELIKTVTCAKQATELALAVIVDDLPKQLELIVGTASGVFDNWKNYREMLEQYCLLVGADAPRYHVIGDMVGNKKGYVGAVAVKDKVFIGDLVLTSKRSAYNNAAWYSFRMISTFDDMRKLDNDSFLEDNINVSCKQLCSGDNDLKLPTEIWMNIVGFLNFESLVKTFPLVCKGFYHMSRDDSQWFCRSTPGERFSYSRSLDLLGKYSNMVGQSFRLRDIIVGPYLWSHYVKRLKKWAIRTNDPKYVVTVSTANAWSEQDFEINHFYQIICKRGFEVDVIYDDISSARAAADARINYFTIKEPYTAVRRIIPAKAKHMMFDIPLEEEMRDTVYRMVMGYGGAIECEFATDPYNRSYMNVLMFFCPQNKSLIEIGCPSI